MQILTILTFLSLLEKIVFLDVILSWTRPFGAKVKQNFTSPIVDPIYNVIRKIIPMRVGMIDFSPLILILLIALLSQAILKYSAEISKLIWA